MAQKGVHLDPEEFFCAICLELLKDPVTIPCGHSYCMSCINTDWDVKNQWIHPRCPQCRETFTPRPVLVKNTMLAVLVEELKKTGLEAADHCYAEDEDVACDVCTGRKRKSVKSCLQCLISYCEKHLRPHYDVPQLKKHKLVAPSKKLQENVCSRHDEVMKMFCRTDQQCICHICCMDEHKGHDTVSAAAERTERQKELEDSRQKIWQRIEDKEKHVKVLQREVEAISRSADEAVENSEKTFTELMRLMEKTRSDVKWQIRSQQQTKVSEVKELEEELEQEITELRKKDAELEKLSHTQDHNQFLHNYPSVSKLSERTDLSSIKMCRLHYFGYVTTAVSQLQNEVQHSVSEGCSNISLMVTQVHVLLSKTELKLRNGLLKYSREITLDPNTVNKELLLSDGNRRVTYVREIQRYPFHSHRFQFCPQVLSRESLTGRCYWEVEWSGGRVCVAVTYKNIKRKGWFMECGLGCNDKSWALDFNNGIYSFRHNHITSTVSGSVSSRIGVYLDHAAGLLSFYSISDTMTLLHRVQTTFTQPLFTGIWLHSGSTAHVPKLR